MSILRTSDSSKVYNQVPGERFSAVKFKVHVQSYKCDHSDLMRWTDTIVLSIIEVESQFLHLDILEHPDLLIRR